MCSKVHKMHQNVAFPGINVQNFTAPSQILPIPTPYSSLGLDAIGISICPPPSLSPPYKITSLASRNDLRVAIKWTIANPSYVLFVQYSFAVSEN